MLSKQEILESKMSRLFPENPQKSYKIYGNKSFVINQAAKAYKLGYKPVSLNDSRAYGIVEYKGKEYYMLKQTYRLLKNLYEQRT